METETKELVPPVNIGDTIELPVIGIGEKGDLIVSVNKYIVFVKVPVGTKIQTDECINLKITKVLPKFGFAELQ